MTPADSAPVAPTTQPFGRSDVHHPDPQQRRRRHPQSARRSTPGDHLAYIILYTECQRPLSTAERRQVQLGFTRKTLGYGRCKGDELYIGKDTDESGIYVTHGNPRLEGYFRVNIGDMHQGFTGIRLDPITRAQT